MRATSASSIELLYVALFQLELVQQLLKIKLHSNIVEYIHCDKPGRIEMYLCATVIFVEYFESMVTIIDPNCMLR